MKLYLRLILSGALLLALALTFAACSGGPRSNRHLWRKQRKRWLWRHQHQPNLLCLFWKLSG